MLIVSKVRDSRNVRLLGIKTEYAGRALQNVPPSDNASVTEATFNSSI